MNIYIALPLKQEQKEVLSKAFLSSDNWWFGEDIDEGERYDFFLQAEVVLGNIPADWVEQSQKLQWLQLNSAGVNQYLEMKNADFSRVKITNLRNFFGIPVAETAVGGILAMYRKLDELARLQSQAEWTGPAVLRPQMDLMHGKKVLILGAGSIGGAIEQLLQAFSCHLTMVRRSVPPTLNQIPALVPEADIVINTLPETPETKGIIDKKTIRSMKKRALFVNVGRGSAIDEDALIKALQQSQIGGAVLDVTAQEPIPRDHPLWTCPNVLLTQHSSGGYREENRDKIKVFIDNLERYRSGKPLRNMVDLDKGY